MRLQIQGELRNEIRREKKKYKEKIEKHLKENHMKKVWHGVNVMSGNKSKHSKSFTNKIKKTTVTTGLIDMTLANASIM